MAYLLGNQSCIESLRSDVQDLQHTINDIFSRVGPVKTHSWKSPDKLASELDIEDLLDLYDCSNDSDEEEERQVAHIGLYELVIDRLILFIQALSKFSALLMGSEQGHQQKDLGSVGLVVKQYWTHMIKLQTIYQQTESENRTKKSKLAELQEQHTKPEHNTDQKMLCQSNTEENNGALHLQLPGGSDMGQSSINSLTRVTNFSVSKDFNSKSCQTYETAFVPCESCDVVQKKLKESGEIVISVCEDQGLPCSLKKFRVQVAHVNLLTFNDICRWMVEQNKDISRIGNFIGVLQGTIGPLKSEVQSCKKRAINAEKDAKTSEGNMTKQKEMQAVLSKQLETKVMQLEIEKKGLVDEGLRQNQALKDCEAKLEEKIKKLGQQLQEQQTTLKQYEIDYVRLEKELEFKKEELKKVNYRAEEMNALKHELNELTLKMESSTKVIAQQEGKSTSVSRHNELLQVKQEGLLKRMEILGQENDDLSQQVASLEEDKSSMEDKLVGLQVETKELYKKVRDNEIIIENLKTDKESLEKSLTETQKSIEDLGKKLGEAKERERMIVEYPDLNGPVNTDYQGTGDIAQDMDNQVISNSIRIKILEEQNQELRESIKKIKCLQQVPSHRPPMEPIPLWKQTASNVHVQQDVLQHHENTRNWPTSKKEEVPMEWRGEREHPKPPKVKQYAWTSNNDHQHKMRSSPFVLSEPSPPPLEFIIGNTPPLPQGKRPDSVKKKRPSSAKMKSVMAPVNTTPIGAYTQMRRAMDVLSTKKEMKKGSPSNLEGRHIPVDGGHGPFSCVKCDKMYSKARDLDIHMTYCDS